MRRFVIIFFALALVGSVFFFFKQQKSHFNQIDSVILQETTPQSPTIEQPPSEPTQTPRAPDEPTQIKTPQKPAAQLIQPSKRRDLSVNTTTGLSNSTVEITTDRGKIQFKFYTQDAPNTVKRFVELIDQKFYNGLVFHRVVPGFVIQTGDPLGNGTGGSGQKLAAEFNQRRHVEGTVAMARAADPNSADSQFYICLDAFPHLDQKYTVFGQVTQGMSVVKAIQMGDHILSLQILE